MYGRNDMMTDRVVDNLNQSFGKITTNIGNISTTGKKFLKQNFVIIILIFYLLYLIFGKKSQKKSLLKYILIFLVLCSTFPFISKIKNKYLNSLILLATIFAVELFFSTFYHTKPEYFEQDDTTDKEDDDEIVIAENKKEEGNPFTNNDLDAGTIENVTYADADYKYKMSELDGMVLERKNEWRIMPKPETVPLAGKKREFTPQGHDIPLKKTSSRKEYLDNEKPPFVDGKEGSERSMVMFDTNHVSLNCCPSTWSTDRGCVCFSEEQREFINTRGGNRTYSPDEI